MGAGAIGAAGPARGVGRQRRVARGGGRGPRRAPGPAGIGACDDRWLQARSGLGELLGVDFETVSAMQLYRASDALVKHREAIEAHLFDRALGLFDLQPTVTLYDLTNTYFEGEASEQPLAQRGHSKEKRSDCPLLTLGLMLDASASSAARNCSPATSAPRAPDAGRHARGAARARRRPGGDGPRSRHRRLPHVAAGTRLPLSGRQPRTPPAIRRRGRRVGPHAVEPDRASAQVVSTDPDEVRLYCYSEERAQKERAIVERVATRFEAALTQLHDGLTRPRAHKRLAQLWQRIGRLKARHTRAAAHYQIAVIADEAGKNAVTWTRRPQDGSMATHPGVYCLRSSETDWDEDALWRTYTTLTDVEAVFRSPQVRARPASHLPSQAAPRRRSPLPHRHRL